MNLKSLAVSFFLLVFPLVPGCRAGNLDPGVLGLFPKDIGEFAYADLETARTLPWFPQFEAQVLPVQFHDFEQFIASAQLSQSSVFDGVAWASLAPTASQSGHPAQGGGILAVATGSFDSDAIKSFLANRKFGSFVQGNFEIYASGTGSGPRDLYFTFLDSNTLAFGTLDVIKRLLDVHSGQEQSLFTNEAMLPMIYQANKNGTFWGVMSASSAAGAVAQLVPAATQFPQSKNLIAKLSFLLISADTSDQGASVDFQAVTSSAQDAVVLSQLLQAGVLLRRYQMGQQSPDTGKILDGTRIGANGPNLEISLGLSTDQLIGLIEHNVFTG